VARLAQAVTEKHTQYDVLINNAGVFKTAETRTQEGLDVRFAVNTLAPYLLTQKLLPLIGTAGRVINVSSAGQSTVDPDALAGRVSLSDDFTAYAQSKLALTMWSLSLALSLNGDGPAIIAVNPGSLLGTKIRVLTPLLSGACSNSYAALLRLATQPKWGQSQFTSSADPGGIGSDPIYFVT